MKRRLILFDIDGTLIHGGPLWRECFEEAFAHCFPELALPERFSFNGKTDPQICREMLEHASGGRAVDVAEVERVIEGYLARVAERLPARAHEICVLPGVKDLLERLSGEPAAIIGLLTGNVRRGADHKLSGAGIGSYFEFGVFGDDHADRYELPRIARDMASRRFGLEFDGKSIVVIGDTIHDVNCGKSIGVRSIAVGTGRGVDRAELLAAEPDHFFSDLSETARVLEAILN